MNKVILIGNLSKDIELSRTQDGVYIGKTSIAIKDFSNGKEEASFFNIKLLGKTAELANQYLVKGSKVCFEGKLRVTPYTDKNGNNREYTEIVVSNMEFLGNKVKENENISNFKDDVKENNNNESKYSYNDNEEIPF